VAVSVTVASDAAELLALSIITLLGVKGQHSGLSPAQPMKGMKNAVEVSLSSV
jgi:hypothetical protein